ncbi:FecR family protein [Roseomonas sp. 18066]|uniref:FecR family protein n=1 Tax=Roseomonas sp. 18066 TaxID=2681412 RepID=UPI00135C9D0D|nr:FecR domain-containing protein [Roseomonas sp. 18066]
MSEPSAEMVRVAAGWHALLDDDAATAADAARCRAWRAEHPGHAEAFRRLAALLGRVDGFAADAPARQALQAGLAAGAQGSAPRRRMARAAGGAVAVLALLATAGLPDWTSLLASHRSGTAVTRLVLADGSAVALDADTAFDTDFDGSGRRIRLHRGRILVEVARDPSRPLTIETPQGTLRALGTRFSAAREEDRTVVAVEESAVRACAPAGACLELHPGQGARLEARQVLGPFPVPAQDSAWAQGQLVVEDRPLSEVLATLARYRPGLLRYDAVALAGLSVSGVLPLGDTDRALAALAATLPIEISRRTGFWVTVERR